MPSNHEQQENLRSTLESYRKAKAGHDREVAEQKRIAQEKRRAMFFRGGVGLVCVILAWFLAGMWLRRDNAFLNMCRTGTAEDVRAAIAKGIWDVNMKDKDGFTPYIASTNNPNREVTEILLRAGANAESVRDLRKPEGCGVNNSVYEDAIRSRPPLSEQEIISAAKKYGFEIVAHKNEYKQGTKDGKPSFSEKIIAQSGQTHSGSVWFCAKSVCIQEGYIIFSPDSFYHLKYSHWRNYPYFTSDSLRSWLSPKLSGELLDRSVNVLMELCY